ncbi:hypothetical protein GCM10023147_44090 [Tsukamurella soli]|uniref:ABC transporter domain-containing protein n=1 Tax=Tsukamurella soli TaxID=644556 RepID=A0ABP8KAF0_9ACTN
MATLTPPAAPGLLCDVRLRDRGVAVHLELPGGETTALVGRNGAGKSTMVDAVAGLLRPGDGRVEIGGRAVADPAAGIWVPPHRRRVALLAQTTRLFPHLSVRANVEFAPRSRGVRRGAARARADRWLDAVGAGDLAGRKPTELSGGQAQRVALARALAAEPEVLLLDEPLAALDVTTASAMRTMLHELLVGRTAVIVTHDAADVLALAHSVAVLHEGALVDHRPTRAALLTPATRFVAQLTGLNYLTTADGAVVFPPDAVDVRPGHAAGDELPARVTDVTVTAGRCRVALLVDVGPDVDGRAGAPDDSSGDAGRPPSMLTADVPLERYSELVPGTVVAAVLDRGRMRPAGR